MSQNYENNTTVKAPTVAAGAVVNIDASGARQVVFEFDPSEANMSRSGSDLVFELDNGGTVNLRNFFEVAEGESLPEFVLADGTYVASAELLAAYDIDATPAAAGVSGGGLNAYNGDPGKFIEGLSALGDQGNTRWAESFEHKELFEGPVHPSGSFGISVNTLGVAGAYEDGMRAQNRGDFTIELARIELTLNPGTSTSVGSIVLSNLPEGAALYRLASSGSLSPRGAEFDPLSGYEKIEPDANGNYTLSEADFAQGIYILPPPNSDVDFDIDVTVEFVGIQSTIYEQGVIHVVVDAVADYTEVTNNTLASDESVHVLGTEAEQNNEYVATKGQTEGEYNTVLEFGKGQGNVTVNVEISASFGDYQDSSEAHYMLVPTTVTDSNGEKHNVTFDANSLGNGYSHTAGDTVTIEGTTYYKILVDNSVIDNANGNPTINLDVTVSDISEDTTLDFNVGSYAKEENINDDELDWTNNESHNIYQNEVAVDVIDSTLTVTSGWASEGNNDAKFLGENSSEYTTQVSQGGATLEASDASNLGAPIIFNLSNSEEFFTSVSINVAATGNSISAAEGSIGYLDVNNAFVPIMDSTGLVLTSVTINGATYDVALNGGKLVFTLASGSAGSNELPLVYQPATTGENQYNSDDVKFDFELSTSNSEGSTATYNGSSTVTIDAVADYTEVTQANMNADESEHELETGAVRDNVQNKPVGQFEGEYSTKSGEGQEHSAVTVQLEVTASFEDYKDGSEAHYMLVPVTVADKDNPANVYDVTLGDLPQDYSHTVGDTITIEGTTYYKILVDNSVIDNANGTPTLNLDVSVADVTSDVTLDFKVGSYAEEENIRGNELDDVNNTSNHIYQNEVVVDVIDSTLTVTSGWASEGNNDAKYKGAESSGYTTAVDQGDATIEVNNNVNIGAPIDFKLSNSEEFITSVSISVGAGDNSISAAEGSIGYMNGNTFVTIMDSAGNVTNPVTIDGIVYNVALTGGNLVLTNTGGAGSSELNLVYQPATTGDNQYNSDDVKFDFELSASNDEGSSATYTGSSTVVIDAVADIASMTNLGVDYGEKYTVAGGREISATAAKPGAEVEVSGSATFNDNDGSEQHFIVLSLSNDKWNFGDASGLSAADVKGAISGSSGISDSYLSGLNSTATDYVLVQLVMNANGEWEATITDGSGSYEYNLTNATGNLPDYMSSLTLGDNGTVSYTVNVTAPSDVANGTVTVGSQAVSVETVVDSSADYEYDYANNVAITGKETNLTVAGADSSSKTDTVVGYEDSSPSKHMETGEQKYTYKDPDFNSGNLITVNTQAGSDGIIKFALNQAGGSTEYITNITFTIEGGLDNGLLYYSTTLIPEGTEGSSAPMYYYTDGGNTVVVINLPVSATGTPSVLTGSTATNIRYVPNADHNDADVKIINVKVDTVNSTSFDTNTLESNTPVTLIIDAVAAKPTDLTEDAAPIYEAQEGSSDPKDAASPGDTVKVEFNVTFNDISDTNENHYILIAVPPAGDSYMYNSVTVTVGNNAPILINASDFTGNVVYIDGKGYYKVTSPEIENAIRGSYDSNDPANTDSVKVTATVDLTLGNSTVDNVNIGYGAAAVDGVMDSDAMNKNNVSVNLGTTEIEVNVVESGISVGLGSAYENAYRAANEEYKSSDKIRSDAYDYLKDSAKITVTFDQQDSNEFIKTATFSVNYENSTDAPGQFYYNGQLVEVPYADNGISCFVDPVTGTVTITIENFDSGADFYFVPGHNYHSEDVNFTYTVTVQDSTSEHDKVFTNDPDYASNNPDAVADINYVVDNSHSAETIVVDAVAQIPVFAGDTSATGNEDAEYIVPGQTATAKVEIMFEDVSDNSETHYIYVEYNPAISLTGTITIYDSNGTPIGTIPVPSTYQNIGGTSYIKIPVSNAILSQAADANGQANITAELKFNTSGSQSLTGNGTGESIHIIASSTDAAEHITSSGNNMGLTNANNEASAGSDITFKFDKMGSISIDYADNVYEGDMAKANTGDYARNYGTEISFDVSNLNTSDNIDSLSFTYNEDRGTLYLFTGTAPSTDADWAQVEAGNWTGAVKVESDAPLTEAQISALQNGGSLHYVPAPLDPANPTEYSTNDSDIDISCNYTISNSNTNETSGDKTANLHIVVDSVAQQGDLNIVDDEVRNLTTGNKTFEIEVKDVKFIDTDTSEEHFVLVQYIPNAVVSVGSTIYSDTLIHDGKEYIKVPVSALTGNEADGYSGTIDVDFANVYITSHTNIDLNIGTAALEKVESGSGGETEYGNNTAVNIEGSIKVTIEGGNGLIYFDYGFENGTPDANINPGAVPNGSGDAHISVDPDIDIDSLVFTYDPSEGTLVYDGVPLIDGLNNGDWPTNVVVDVQPGGTYKVTITDPGNNPDLAFRPGDFSAGNVNDYKAEHPGDGYSDNPEYFYNYSGADPSIKWEINTTDDTGGYPTSGTTNIVIDSVAQAGEVSDAANADDAISSGTTGADNVVVHVDGFSFPDSDSSETHYLLIEKQPGINIDIADHDCSNVITIGGVAYYQIELTDTDIANGLDVTVTVDQNLLNTRDNPNLSATPDSDGSTIYSLNTGTMSVEKDFEGQEVTASNNVAINVDNTFEFKVSGVNTTVTTSASNTYENGDAPAGKEAMAESNVQFNINPDANDVVNGFTITYDSSFGELAYPDGSEITTDSAKGVTVSDINGNITITFTPGGSVSSDDIVNLINNGFKFKPEGNDSTDVKLNWNMSVSDPLSGDSKNPSGSVTIKVDAVAQAPEIDPDTGVNATYGDNTAAVSGGEATVELNLNFPDSGENGEVHYALLEYSDDIYCNTATVNGENYTVTVMNDSAGNKYYAVLLPKGSDMHVEFNVTVKDTVDDTALELKVGGIAVENYNRGADGEFDLSNNWAENLSNTVTIDVNMANSDIGSEAGNVAEHGSANENNGGASDGFNLNVALTGTNDVITQLVITNPPANGTIEYKGTVVNVVNGTITIIDPDGVVDGSQITFVPNDYWSGRYTPEFKANIKDSTSGDTSTSAGTGGTITVDAVATPGSIDSAAQAGSTLQGAHEATATIQVSGSFPDTDSSESHYVLVKFPDGCTPNGNYSSITAPAGSPFAGETVYVIPVGNGLYTLNIGVTVTEQYDPDSSVQLVTMSEEKTATGDYAYSEVSGVAIDVSEIDFNFAPEGVDSADAATQSANGSYFGQFEFTDTDGDAVSLHTVNGNNIEGIGWISNTCTITDVDGSGSTLVITRTVSEADGYTYSYEFQPGDAVTLGENISLTFTGVDSYGGAESAPATSSFEINPLTYSAGSSGDVDGTGIYGWNTGVTIYAHEDGNVITAGDGNDTIYLGFGASDVSGGDGQDTFIWNDSAFGGSTDSILDFSINEGDKLAFNGLFNNSAEITETNISQMLTDGILSVTMSNDSTVELTVNIGTERQTVNVNLSQAYTEYDTSFNDSTDAQAALLNQLLTTM